jgi:anti-sigma factor RsiW
MNCDAFEPLIALYVGADLPDRDRPQVEQHLTACPDCRQLLEDLQASQAALRELGSEAVDAAMLTAVRAGVLGGIGERRRRVWPWVAAFAALLTALIVTPRKPIEQLPPPVVARTLPPERVVETPTPPRRRHVARRRPAPPPAEAQPLVVKMLTDDPDIVIIWLVDQRGE